MTEPINGRADLAVVNGIKVWSHPRLTLISRPEWLYEILPFDVNWIGDASDGEKLAEFAGRLCYMSQHNPAEKPTAQYLGDILKQAHGSVLEHANYSMLIEGVSRSLTHELVRHRAGWAYSQLSQRYVGPEHVGFVIPLALIGRDSMLKNAIAEFSHNLSVYQHFIDWLEEVTREEHAELSKRDFRKRIQQTARAFLPNATETKLVATGNIRAWRTMLELRGAPGAEPEIRRMAVGCFRILQDEAPGFFSDGREVFTPDLPDFPYCLEFQHHKV